MRKFKVITILIIFLNIGCDEFNRTENLLYKVEELKNENDSIKKENLTLQRSTDSLKNKENKEVNYWFDNDYEALKFKRLEIEDPEKFIEDNLRNRTDLIPIKASLGGKMKFGKIQLLGEKWLIAEYDDGHIQGKSIYSYNLNSNKEIDFKILESIRY